MHFVNVGLLGKVTLDFNQEVNLVLQSCAQFLKTSEDTLRAPCVMQKYT